MNNIEVYNYILSNKFKDNIEKEEVKEIKNIMKVIWLSVYLGSLTGIREINIPLNYWNVFHTANDNTYELSKYYSLYTTNNKLIEDNLSYSRGMVTCKDEKGYTIFRSTTEVRRYMKNYYQNLEILKEEEKIKYKEEENMIRIKKRSNKKEENQKYIIQDILKTNEVIRNIISKNYLELEYVDGQINNTKKKIKI